jgi:hypothetical protein
MRCFKRFLDSFHFHDDEQFLVVARVRHRDHPAFEHVATVHLVEHGARVWHVDVASVEPDVRAFERVANGLTLRRSHGRVDVFAK